MGNFVLRSIVWIAAIAVWLLLRRPVGMDWTHLSWQPGVVLGGLVVLIGLACYVWSASALASGVANTINAPARLLTRGPFAYVRNPLYLSAAAAVAGLTTMYRLWQRQDVFIVPIVGVLVHLFVIYHEEPRTRERLGPAYDSYRATVPRWFPRF